MRGLFARLLYAMCGVATAALGLRGEVSVQQALRLDTAAVAATRRSFESVRSWSSSATPMATAATPHMA